MTVEEYTQNGVWYLLGICTYLCVFIYAFQSYYFLMMKYDKKPILFPSQIDVKALFELAFTDEHPEAKISARVHIVSLLSLLIIALVFFFA